MQLSIFKIRLTLKNAPEHTATYRDTAKEHLICSLFPRLNLSGKLRFIQKPVRYVRAVNVKDGLLKSKEKMILHVLVELS